MQWDPAGSHFNFLPVGGVMAGPAVALFVPEACWAGNNCEWSRLLHRNADRFVSQRAAA